MEEMTLPVHVEVELVPSSLVSKEAVETALREKFQKCYPFFREGVVKLEASDCYYNDIVRILICDLGVNEIPFWKAEILFYIYKNLDGESEKDFLDGEEDLPACDQWELPSQSLSRLWEAIIVENHIKRDILGYATSAMIFTSALIDPDIISWNRMILLHGPPGSGKTTLCKAIAQKLYIRNMSEYDSGFLLEINSHSLFSKWFSESGKLVMKLFDHINDIADDPKSFVCILIDEVESITSSRTSSLSSNEPGDAVRVVNAVLTSLDALKRRRNVIVLCTSNMQDAIDPAFRDRADLQVFLGPPTLSARYMILKSCLEELSLKGVICTPCYLTNYCDINQYEIEPDESSSLSSKEISPNELEQWARCDDHSKKNSNFLLKESSGMVSHNAVSTGRSSSDTLLQIARRCEGYSGRSLRKLPLKAHAMYVQRKKVSLEQYLGAILMTVAQNKN